MRLGAKTAVITGGGDPLLQEGVIKDIVAYCSRAGLWVVVFRNGRLVRPATAGWLKRYGVSVIAKGHALSNEACGDWLAA
jgi:MoaA/NifB/PqqE/SkfB family radical SAM enzyme